MIIAGPLFMRPQERRVVTCNVIRYTFSRKPSGKAMYSAKRAKSGPMS